MFHQTLEFLNGKCIGIIGAGKLGKSIALALIQCGFPKEQIIISCRGNEETIEKMKSLNLYHNLEISNNQKLIDKSKIILLTIRAQDIISLRGLEISEEIKLLSFLPGVSIETLKILFNKQSNIMIGQTCGPDIILDKKGLIAMFPSMEEPEEQLFVDIGMNIFPLPREDLIHIYGTSMCLGAAFCMCDKMGIEYSINDAIYLTEKYVGVNYVELFNWAIQVKPSFKSNEERDLWMMNHCTKGGLTETIINNIQNGNSFLESVLAGVERSKELFEQTKLVHS